MPTCANGHQTSATDYCDQCGSPMGSAEQSQPSSAASSPAPVSQSAGIECPQCQAVNVADALFCEACGFDFLGGPPASAPAGSGSAPAESKGSAAGEGDTTGEADLDEDTTTATTVVGSHPSAPQGPENPSPNVDVEWVVELWIDPDWYAVQNSPDPLPSPGVPETVPLRHRSVLIGRTSRSRNINPDIDCASDTGVSRRQAQLTTDGTRWFIEDLDSANGTFVAPASGVLPSHPIQVGKRTELDADDRVYFGAWSRMVIREATEEEKQSG